MKYLYLNKYWEINIEYNIDKLLFLMIDRPNKISNNYIIWSNRNYDLPSYVYQHFDGKRYNLHWVQNDKSYRKNNKPAYIGHDGYKQYYMNGKLIKRKYLK